MVHFHGQTDVGRRRQTNEDTVYARNGLFLVCDGIGGHNAGEVASKLAADTIASFIASSVEDPDMTWPYGYDPALSTDANRLSTAVRLANGTVFRKAASAAEYAGMGTTVASVLVDRMSPRMTYAHVGDSRIYLIRRGVMRQLTRDDTWANVDWPHAGGGVSGSTMHNVLTKALGIRDDVQVAVNEQELEDADLVLLCSDGLTNMLADAKILDVVSAPARDLEAACRELVWRANAEGGRDNISLILLRYVAEDQPGSGPISTGAAGRDDSEF